ncbi:MAG: hypothetical protein JNN17_12595 [Verrucomicrobiaceae bacterium]|nr:hypothetical protein [Verrucomicrobiaceae bacterium]
MKTPRSQALLRAVLLLALCFHAWTAFAVTYTNVFFNASQTRTVLASSINEVTIRSGDYTFAYSVDGYWAPYAGGQPTGRFFSVNWPTGVQAQAITAGPLLGRGGNIILKRVDGQKFDLKAFTGKILMNTAGAGGAFEIMPLVDGEDAFNDPLMYDCTGYSGASFSHTPSLVNYDTYKIHMWGDFALTALTLIDTNAPLTFNIAASVSSAAMGSVSGAGSYDSGTSCTLSATANAGYYFVNWTEGGVETSTLADYTFTAGANRTLVANFAALPVINTAAPAVPGAGFTFAWPATFTGWVLEESADLTSGNWVPSTETITTNAGQKSITIPAPTGHRFFRLTRP